MPISLCLRLRRVLKARALSCWGLTLHVFPEKASGFPQGFRLSSRADAPRIRRAHSIKICVHIFCPTQQEQQRGSLPEGVWVWRDPDILKPTPLDITETRRMAVNAARVNCLHIRRSPVLLRYEPPRRYKQQGGPTHHPGDAPRSDSHSSGSGVGDWRTTMSSKRCRSGDLDGVFFVYLGVMVVGSNSAGNVVRSMTMHSSSLAR